MSNKILAFLLTVSAVLFYFQKRGWINLNNQNRPSMGNPLGVFDEIFNSTKHQSTLEIKEQKERKIDFKTDDQNHIHIDLSKS